MGIDGYLDHGHGVLSPAKLLDGRRVFVNLDSAKARPFYKYLFLNSALQASS